MKIKNFQIKNYQSILDSGVIELSTNDNFSIFAGQNESGKSSILKALSAYERDDFTVDDVPFEVDDDCFQSVSVTYSIDDKQSFFDSINSEFIELKKVEGDDIKVFDKEAIFKLEKFTITRRNTAKGSVLDVDSHTFNVIKNSVCKSNKQTEENVDATIVDQVDSPEAAAVIKKADVTIEKFFEIKDEDNTAVADIFFSNSPTIVYFDDLCDVLPDKIQATALNANDTSAVGYRAVRNFETQIGTKLTKKESLPEGKRIKTVEKDNDAISVSFQEDWGQRIHNTNEVIIRYNYEVREEDKSHISFFVETKKGVLLPLRQRSKGLVWFLSLWLELKSRNKKHKNLVLLLDEPDQHLHVRAQEDILKLMKKLSGEGSQILCATHSPYLLETDHLTRIKLVINDDKLGTTAEDITTAKIDSSNKVDALKPIADAIGLHASDFSPLTKKNVLLEGVSDFNYYLAMQLLLSRGGEYSFIPGVGLRKINSLISLCIGYGFDWLVVMDDDPEVGGLDSKTKYDEIKDKVFDGNEDETKKHVMVTSGVVGIENMFELDDLKLTGMPFTGTSKDNVKRVGDGRKIMCSKIFLEKVRSGEIKIDNISTKAKKTFISVFDFIDTNLV